VFSWLNLFPAVVWGILLFAAMLLAALLGHVLHLRLARRGESRDEPQEGYVVSSVVTLLAFMIGFTFAIGLDRFEQRRELVVEDAQAIEKLYLQAQILEEPHRSRLSSLLVRYTDNLIELAQDKPGEQDRALAESNRLLRDIWTATIPAFDSVKGMDFSSAFVEAANSVFEVDTARRAARNARIPSEVFVLMFGYAIVTALVFGYVLQGRRGRVSGALLLVLCVTAIVLLIDLNQPVTGAIRESQQPIEILSKWLHANPPPTFDRLRAAPDQVARAPTPGP
jgi:hypothetical protein